MADAVFGAKHNRRLVDEIKREQSRRADRLRRAATVDGYPPGTVPVQDARQQLSILSALRAHGAVFTPQEQRRWAELSAQSPQSASVPPLLPGMGGV